MLELHKEYLVWQYCFPPHNVSHFCNHPVPVWDYFTVHHLSRQSHDTPTPICRIQLNMLPALFPALLFIVLDF